MGADGSSNSPQPGELAQHMGSDGKNPHQRFHDAAQVAAKHGDWYIEGDPEHEAHHRDVTNFLEQVGAMKQQIIDAFVSLKETDESTYQKRLGKYNELKELYLEKLKKHRKNAQGSKVSEASKQHHETMRSVKGQIHSHIKDILNQVQRDDEVPADGGSPETASETITGEIVKRLFFSEEALKVAREALEKKNEKSNGLTPEGLLLQQLQSVLRYVSESKPFPEPIGAVTQFIIHLLIENKYIQLVDNQGNGTPSAYRFAEIDYENSFTQILAAYETTTEETPAEEAPTEETYEPILAQDWLDLKKLLRQANYGYTVSAGMEDVLKIVVELDCGSIEELRADVTNKLDTNISVELLRKCLYGCQLLGLIDENGKRIVEDKDLKSRITVLITDGVPARSGNEWQEEEETYERILVQDWLHLKRLLGHAGYPGSNGHSVMVDVLKIVVESNCTNLEELTNLVVSRVLNRSTELLKKCIWGCQLLSLIDEQGRRVVENAGLKLRITLLITNGVPAWREEVPDREQEFVEQYKARILAAYRRLTPGQRISFDVFLIPIKASFGTDRIQRYELFRNIIPILDQVPHVKYYPGGNRRARTITLEGIDWSTTRDESEGEGQETIEWHEQLDAAAWLVIQCNYVSERMLINRLGIGAPAVQTLLSQLVQLGIIEVALPADWRLLVELSVDVADTNNYQAIFLEFLHQRQADHTAGRPLTDRDERMETHPLEGDEHGEYTPLEIDLLWIGRHRLRQHLSADGSEQFGTQYTGWLESLDRFRFGLSAQALGREKLDRLVERFLRDGILDFHEMKGQLDRITRDDFIDQNDWNAFRSFGPEAFQQLRESIEISLARRAKGYANTYLEREDQQQRIDIYARDYVSRYCRPLEAIVFEHMRKQGGFSNELFEASFIAVLEPGNDLPHLGGHYASQAGMDFEVLVKEACFTVFDTIYENLCVLAPGVNNARLFTLLADQLGNDDTPQDRYEQVFGRHTYNIWSADRRVRRKNIESLQAEFAHYTQAWEDHKGWTKAKLFAVLFEGVVIEMVTDPIKRINKKLFVGKPLDSQRKELPGDHIDIGERGRQLGCNDLGIEVLPGETGKLVLHARIYNHAYSFDVNGQKGNPVLPVQKLMQKIESSHDLGTNTDREIQQKAFLMLKAATGCLALLCKAQGGTVYQHAGDQHHYVVTTESGHVVIYQRTVTDDKVAYTPIFDENDFPPTAGTPMALNQLLRHIQMVAEHAERAFQTKHLINESAKRALKSSKKDLMVVPKKNRGKIENTAPTTKLEKIKKFAGWKVMMERYTIEGEEIMVGNKKKKQEKLTLPRENEGLGGFTFLYQPTPTSPTVMYAVLTEGSSTYVYQIHTAGSAGEYIIEKSYNGIGQLRSKMRYDKDLLYHYTDALFQHYFAQDRIKDTMKTFIFQGDDSRYYTICASNAHPGYRIHRLVDEDKVSEVQQQLAAGKATRTSAYILPKTLCKSGSIETEPITKRSKPRRTLVVDGYTYVKGNRGNRLYNLRELHDASDMRGDYSGSIRSIPTLHSLIAAMNEAVK